ncbi:DUF2567 domain-containing protein [Mycobacterium talmoniae]|uniref:DUF2567 domain-containing protein n=1 Tax=Mycobacterium talmoniae TaxID=1858794 RepID=A0A1S1MWQ3_9MYCO|nr:DUF2567 domain-containing protein [Mycobacterium talmoniae]OHU93325.1 hypothetical protein BKN37_24180 [Mycobacterium talmoniae]
MTVGAGRQQPRQAAPRTTRPRALALVLGGLALVGVAVGALWSWLAPPIHGVVALTRDGDRVHAYLGPESDHFFVAAALMLGLLGVVAVVAAALVWQWRAHRGPEMVVALSAGLLAAAAAAMAAGAVLVRLRYGVVDVDGAPVTPDHRVHYFTEAPPVFFGHTPLQIAASLLLPAATAALVYALGAASNARDDLGGYPPVASFVETVAAPAGAVSLENGAANRP